MLYKVLMMQSLQLVDSSLASTRRYWRKEVWGLSDEIADDPRPLKEILGAWPDWQTCARSAGELVRDEAPSTPEGATP